MFNWFNLIKVEVLIDGEFSHNVTIPKRIIENWNPSMGKYTVLERGDVTDRIKKQSKKTRNCIAKCYFGYYGYGDGGGGKIDTSRYMAWFYTA